MNEHDAHLRDMMALVVAPRGSVRQAILAKRIAGRTRYVTRYVRRKIRAQERRVRDGGRRA